MGWDQSPVDGNGMGSKLSCVVMGWDGKLLVLGWDAMGNFKCWDGTGNFWCWDRMVYDT